MNCERCGKKLGSNVYDIHTCTPIKKEWVGLTDEERNEILGSHKPSFERYIAELIEAKLKEKNGN